MPSESILVWRRLIPSRLTDEWLARLIWVGPEQTVIEDLPSGKSSRLTVYDLSNTDAQTLKEQFGGEIRKLKQSHWMKSQERNFSLVLEKKICLRSPAAKLTQAEQDLPQIIIPAGPAFGTGEHPTTRMCLRHAIRLAEVGAHPKQIADLGTGSGIIALTLNRLGHSIEAIDFDEDCIRESQNNEMLNPGLAGVNWHHLSVFDWKPGKKFDLIVANLFSEILIEITPLFNQWLKPGGDFVLSGVMKHQEEKVRTAILKAGLQIEKRLRVGKWVAFIGSR